MPLPWSLARCPRQAQVTLPAHAGLSGTHSIGWPAQRKVLCNKSKETTCPHCCTPSLGISSVSPLAARSCGRCCVAELCVNAATGDIHAARADGFAWGVEGDADAAQQYVGQRLDVTAAVTPPVLAMVEASQWAVPTIDAAHIAPVEGA